MKKTALITGGSSGIGKELAYLMSSGFEVGIVGRDETKLEKVASSSESIHSFTCDLTSVEDCRRLVAEANKRLGRIDVLVNNAGASVSGSIVDIPESEFEKIWRLNFLAPVTLTKEAIPLMQNHYPQY